jgi:Spy/CpxP family protein refolding chaperone
MNRLLLSTSLALALSGTVVLAQQAETPAPAAKHHHAHSPRRETARLSKKLNLSPEQSAKIEPILADRDQKMTALKNDSTISPLIMQQKMKALHQQTRQQLATVLTPEQLQQIKSHRHNHGAPSQTQPLTPPNPQAGL